MYSRNSRRAVSWVQYQFICYVHIQQFNVFTFYQLIQIKSKLQYVKILKNNQKRNEIKEFNIE